MNDGDPGGVYAYRVAWEKAHADSKVSRPDYRKLAAEIAEGSIVTKALARFLEQVIEETVGIGADRIIAQDALIRELVAALATVSDWQFSFMPKEINEALAKAKAAGYEP